MKKNHRVLTLRLVYEFLTTYQIDETCPSYMFLKSKTAVCNVMLFILYGQTLKGLRE